MSTSQSTSLHLIGRFGSRLRIMNRVAGSLALRRDDLANCSYWSCAFVRKFVRLKLYMVGRLSG
jgi:hypothetical protein